MSGFEYLDILTSGDIQSLVVGLVSTVLILLGYKLSSRYIARLCKRLKLEAHVENVMRLALRIAAAAVLLGTLSSTYGVSVSILLGGSALVGTVIGFGSSQTINNLVAGFYVMVTRPFTIRDYVKIGADVEGQVEEITFNYTKLYTPSMNLVSVPNVQVLNSRITNCTHEGLIKYNVLVSLPHDMNIEKLIKKCVNPAIDSFYAEFRESLVRKPEYFIEPPDFVRRTVRIRLFVPKGNARDLYLLQPNLIQRIVTLWDLEAGRSP